MKDGSQFSTKQAWNVEFGGDFCTLRLPCLASTCYFVGTDSFSGEGREDGFRPRICD